MKILISLALIFACAFNAFASSLVLKVTKEIKNPAEREYIEILNFDTGKYKQIRIGIIRVDWNKVDTSSIKIEAVEGEDVVNLEGFPISQSRSIEFENLPTKIRISTITPGTYKILIWAS